jgi:hypothetical protein
LCAVAILPDCGRDQVQAAGLVAAFIVDKCFIANLLNGQFLPETAGLINLMHEMLLREWLAKTVLFGIDGVFANHARAGKVSWVRWD